MAKIKITCDSTCDLTPELYKRFDLEVLPLEVTLGDRVCHDGVDVTTGELYDYAQKTGTLPKTSAISVGTYEDCFRRWTGEGYDVIHINISNKLSDTTIRGFAKAACEAFPGRDISLRFADPADVKEPEEIVTPLRQIPEILDNTRLKKLGWEPKVTLIEGIRRAVGVLEEQIKC